MASELPTTQLELTLDGIWLRYPPRAPTSIAALGEQPVPRSRSTPAPASNKAERYGGGARNPVVTPNRGDARNALRATLRMDRSDSRGAGVGAIVSSLDTARRDGDQRSGSATVRSILCLKLDHIGDMLIAAPALMLLRRSFPGAHITLVCGPWNVGLAHRLAIADAVVPVSIFSQNSAADLDPEARLERRRAAVEALQAQPLGPFDLAIDLRRDEDTRDLLKLFDAGVYAGIGDLDTFGYLDVALPSAREPLNEGATSLRLGPADLDGGMGHRIDDEGLHLSVHMGQIDLDIATDQLWAPDEDGVGDTRLLGAALSRIDIRTPLDRDRAGGSDRLGPPAEIPRDSMAFGPGWQSGEPWGRWSSTEAASLSLTFPTTGPEVELLVRLQGHTSPSHPAASIRVSASDGEAQHRFEVGDEPVTLPLTCKAAVSRPVARSDPFLLRGGRYVGRLTLSCPTAQDWRPLTLVVLGARLLHVLAKVVTPTTMTNVGVLAFPFEIDLRDSAEPIVIEVRSDIGAAATGVGILSVELTCTQARTRRLPLVHMEAQLLDLAAMVALRYAPRLVQPGSEVAANLSCARPRSSARDAVTTLRALKPRRRVFGPEPAQPRIIGIGIGANKDTKRWSEAYFLDLCQRLLARGGTRLVFVGGPKEAEEVRTLVSQLDAGERVIDLCSCCRIEDLGEVLAELDGFIGLDTGTTHFAGRVGVKTLALFGAAHDPKEWGPVGSRSAWAAVDVPCGSCFKSELSECGFALRCMTMLKPADIWPLVESHLL